MYDKDEIRILECDTIPEFDFEEYFKQFNKLDAVKKQTTELIDVGKDRIKRFQNVCLAVKDYIYGRVDDEINTYSSSSSNYKQEKKSSDKQSVILKRQRDAMIGHQNEVNFFLSQIDEYLKANHLSGEWYPNWYRSLSEGIFHEVWGFSVIANWIYGYTEELSTSSSAKIVGDKIYYLIDGKQVLQPQEISEDRRKLLRKALLLGTPKKRDSDGYFELYTLDGTRITIFGDDFTKDGQDTFVFRKFLVKDYSFDRQAELGTIPKEAIPMFKNMVKVGYNVAFIGAVRTAKTTFLTTWQCYEDRTLEGIMVETDPEIPIHKIMPKAPIVQLVADGEKLESIVKSILRADADYIIMAEARDAVAFNIALDVTDRGTRRSKMTAHFSRGEDFPYNIAKKIVEKYGGNVKDTQLKVCKNFQYIFEFIQLPDKSKKRLKGIYEMYLDTRLGKAYINKICNYNFKTDSWEWQYYMSEDKRIIGEEENIAEFEEFDKRLRELADKYPMQRKIDSYIIE